jgi:acetylglutamate synthase
MDNNNIAQELLRVAKELESSSSFYQEVINVSKSKLINYFKFRGFEVDSLDLDKSRNMIDLGFEGSFDIDKYKKRIENVLEREEAIEKVSYNETRYNEYYVIYIYFKGNVKLVK